MILKVVMSPLEPAKAFVEQYVRLVQGYLAVFFPIDLFTHIRYGSSRTWKTVRNERSKKIRTDPIFGVV